MLGVDFCFCCKHGWPLPGSWHTPARLVGPNWAKGLEQRWQAASTCPGTLASSTSLPALPLSGELPRLSEAQPELQAPDPEAQLESIPFYSGRLTCIPSAWVSWPTFLSNAARGFWFPDTEYLPWTPRPVHRAHLLTQSSHPLSVSHLTPTTGWCWWLQIPFPTQVCDALTPIPVQMPCASTSMATSPHTRFPVLAPPAFSFMGLSDVIELTYQSN